MGTERRAYRRTTRALVVASVSSAMLAMNVDAYAFCRKTTCVPEKEHCPRDEHGCVTVGAPIRWPKLPIVYRFSAEHPGQLVREEARAAVRAAFHRWSDTLCPDGRRTSLRFVEGEDIVGTKPLEPRSRAPEPYGIFFRDLGWPYVGRDSTLAQTNTMFKKPSGFVDYADIEINVASKRFSTREDDEGVDLQAVMTHEVGHYIGLDHSDVSDSIMVDSYCAREGRCEKGKVAARRLSLDDIEAVCTLYPPDGPPSSETPPPSADGCTTAARNPESPHSAVPIAAPAALLLAAAVRRRRERT